MKPLHWRPSHSTFHLLNWSLERSFGGYLVQICSGWGRGRKSPGLVSSISIPATSSWWWGRGAAGERGVALTKNKWEQIDFWEELTVTINVVNESVSRWKILYGFSLELPFQVSNSWDLWVQIKSSLHRVLEKSTLPFPSSAVGPKTKVSGLRGWK